MASIFVKRFDFHIPWAGESCIRLALSCSDLALTSLGPVESCKRLALLCCDLTFTLQKRPLSRSLSFIYCEFMFCELNFCLPPHKRTSSSLVISVAKKLSKYNTLNIVLFKSIIPLNWCAPK